MLLKEVIKSLSLSNQQENIEILGVSVNFDDIKKGDIFFDLKGQYNANKIFEKGARFIVRFGEKDNVCEKNIVVSSQARKIYALACKNFFNGCCDKLKLIGITGTNGKSSTIKLIADILKSDGKKVATIGTMGCSFDDIEIETGFTTPDPHILHSLFSKIYSAGVEYVVMEVSAHALELDKCEGMKFEVVALTNITQDHLDFFGDMQSYADAKIKLFSSKYAKCGVVCIDDEIVLKNIDLLNIPLSTYGVNNPSDIFAIDIESDMNGSCFICNSEDNIFHCNINLVGEYNVLNSLCAVGVCTKLDVPLCSIIDGLRYSQPEIGRFNVLSYNDINIVIDFAHTPDAMQKILQTVKPICKGKLITLFGCGGNRDKTKRAKMGAIASIYSDEIVITSDNPRFEKPLDIIDEIIAGVENKKYLAEENRAKAISLALSNCQKDDVLLILGKGGENYQIFGDQKVHFSDFEEVHKYFRSLIKNVNQQDVERCYEN